MKKLAATLAISFCCHLAASAQNFWEESNKKLEFGVEAGYNNSLVTSGGLFSSGYAMGYNVSLSGDYFFSDHWSLKVKAGYDQKGWGNGTFTDAAGNETDGVSFKLNYVTVPIMANWHFGRTKNWYLSFGPYVGVLVNANESADNTNIKSTFNTTDEGLAYGIGIKFPVAGDKKLFIEFGGQSGVTNIFRDSSSGIYQNARETISVGLSF